MINVYENIEELGTFEELQNKTRSGQVSIVKSYFNKKQLDLIEAKILLLTKEEPTWMPLDDQCNDYHRINDEYPGSFVQAKTHSFMFHFFNNQNRDLLEATLKLWEQKLSWVGLNNKSEVDKKLEAKPSDGYIPRLVSHLYPAGGGYLAPHTDPYNPHNPIQTLIVGSKKSVDFLSGGLHVTVQDKEICIDEFCEPGDLVIFDQSYSHEVKPVDSDLELDWSSMSGRLQHVLLFARSDYLKGQVSDVKAT